MSDKTNKIDSLLNTFRKGKELYDEYGDTVVSVVKPFLLKRDRLGINPSLDMGMLPECETADEETEELTETTPVHIPSDIRQYRTDIESDDSFHESLVALEDAVSFVYKGGPKTPEDVEQALRILEEVAQDTIKYAEEQETKREEIRAMRDTAIAQINAMKECVQAYLEQTFDERSAIFAKQFEAVDSALTSGDNEMLAESLNSINALAASSPFKNLADIRSVQQSLISSDTEWDI